MRLKLTENLRFNSHKDASLKRDLTGIPDMMKTLSVNVPLTHVPEVDDADAVDDDEVTSVSQEDISR